MIELLTDWNLLARGVIAFVIAFGVTLAVGNKVILKLISMKLGQPVRSKEEVNDLFDLHGKKAGTPTMGGVMILSTMILATLLAGDLKNPYIHVCLFVLIALGALGFKDDYAKISQGNAKGVSSKYKLAWQLGVAAIASLWVFFAFDLYPEVTSEWSDSKFPNTAHEIERIYKVEHFGGLLNIPFFSDPLNLSWIYILFGILVLVGASNAVNLTDGLDGLASGCTISTAVVYTIVSVYSSFAGGVSHPAAAELMVFTLAMAGSVTGFLWFNAYPARVFMGDTGSLALGGALGAVALCTKQEILLVMVGFVFVAEALSVMAQVSYFKYTKKKWGEGKRLLKCAPIHHHFELQGWKETQVITRFWIISGVCGGLGLAIFLR